jgi:hypothetical protein
LEREIAKAKKAKATSPLESFKKYHLCIELVLASIKIESVIACRAGMDGL